METLCKVKLVTPEGVAVTRLQKGVEKDGEEVALTAQCVEEGKNTFLYELSAGAYRFLSEGEGYYTYDKDFIVHEGETEKTVEACLGKMAGTHWEQNNTVRHFSDERLYSEANVLSEEVREKYSHVFTTPSFAPTKAACEFTTQEELEQYLASLSSPYLRIYPLGKSKVHGLTLYAAVFSKSDISAAETLEQAAEILRANGKPTVLDQAQIHGNEQSAGEAALVLLRELCGGYGEGILDKLNVVVLPRINVDGARDYTYSPVEETNINRDFCAITDVETPMLLRVYNAFLPEMVIDHHEFGTIKKYQFDVKIGGQDNLNLPQQLRDLQYVFLNYELDQMRAEGFRSAYFRSPRTDTNPATGRGAYFTRGSLSILIEIPGVKKGKIYWERRVLCQYLSSKHLLDYAAAHAHELRATVAQTRLDIVRAGLHFDPIHNLITLEHRPGTPVYLNSAAYSLEDGSYLGDEIVAFYRFDKPTHQRPRPLGYVIPKTAENIERMMEIIALENISYREVTAGETLTVRGYRGSAASASLSEETQLSFPEGAYFFPTAQTMGVVLSVLMEPDILDCTQGAASFVQQELLSIEELYRCEK